MNVILFGLIVGFMLVSIIFRKRDWALSALIALLFVSLGIMTDLNRYDPSAMWLGLI